MGGNVMFHDLLINGIPLVQFGGKTLLDYTIGPTPLTNDVFQGINRSNWVLLKQRFGLRLITLTILFDGPDLRSAKLARSKFNSKIFGKNDIYIPDDGFFYSVYCENIGDEIFVGEGDKNAQIKSEYQFTGIRHDALRTVSVPHGGKMNCLSTMPFTDCRLTATVGTSGSNYQLGGVKIASVAAGDVIVFDGINCAITKNGANAAASATWMEFPTLIPGENAFTCADTVKVEYYPTYI